MKIEFETVDAIESRYHERHWAFASDRAAEIDAHWRAATRDRPGMFDGRVLLMDDWRIEERAGARVLATRHFSTNFRNFLAFRDFGFPDPAIRNCFAAAVLVSADGHAALGEMGAHTANAGRVYFPCGTPDMDDVRGGAVDLAGSVLRELAEETGVAPPDAQCEPGWTVVFEGARVACMKIVRSPLGTDALAARIEAFLAGEKEPELSGVHVVRTPADLLPDAMPGFTTAYLERALAEGWFQPPG
ncbi:MAG: hydrolase [Hyphomicrobiales bacterium]|nr:hydrolase [Hyphomicrobiales bacterium]